MFSKMAAFVKKIVRRFALIHANMSYENKRKYLNKKGARIGKNTRLICNVDAFGTEPYLIETGDDCLFASNVNFITHDGAVKVLNSLGKFNGSKMDIIAPIKIGNNVYIGMGAYIMPGVQIGDNCIIGAGSIVTKSIPANSVAVGIPARVIEDVDTYFAHVKKKGNIYQTVSLDDNEKRMFFYNIRLLDIYFETIIDKESDQ